MPSFKQDEIYTATEVVRNFGAVLSKVSDGKLKKAVIVKNNKFEAVMLSLKEYERLERAVELLDIVYSQKRHKDGD